MHRPIFTDHVMGADLAFHRRESCQRLLTAILRSVMKNNKIWLAQIKIRRANKTGRVCYRILQWIFRQQFSIVFRLLFITFIGGLVWIWRAAIQNYDYYKT